MEKRCTKCLIEKPLTLFNKQNTGKMGRRSYCKECQRNARREYYKKNKEKESEYQIKYRKKNPNYNKDWQKNKREVDILFRLQGNLRARLSNIIKEKTKKTIECIGTDIYSFKRHIEDQFVYGMCWENYGEWHIDHIIPLSHGKTEDEILKLHHYKNLQPLWKEDNLKKGNKILN